MFKFCDLFIRNPMYSSSICRAFEVLTQRSRVWIPLGSFSFTQIVPIENDDLLDMDEHMELCLTLEVH